MRIIAFIGIALLYLLSSCERGEHEIIVVPENYKGHFVVIFNVKTGKPRKYSGKTRIYEIPSNGILKTQFTGNYGWRGLTEFYRGSVSADNQLPSFAEINRVPTNMIVGLIGPIGTQRKDTISDDSFEIAEFYVGTKIEIDSLLKFTEIIDVSKIAEQDSV